MAVERLSQRDAVIAQALAEKLQLFSEMAELTGLEDMASRSRLLLRGDTSDLQQGENLLKGAITEGRRMPHVFVRLCQNQRRFLLHCLKVEHCFLHSSFSVCTVILLMISRVLRFSSLILYFSGESAELIAGWSEGGGSAHPGWGGGRFWSSPQESGHFRRLWQ